jgi:hypothetical protein
VTLSGGDYTAQNGDVLTGSTSGTVTIARGASITLSDVKINGGIVCEGTATIILVGTNSVTGLQGKAGIQVGSSGTTLTIKGNGALTANGGLNGAGIGASPVVSGTATLGNITIEGGSITANGGDMSAGIGTGFVWNGIAELGTLTIYDDIDLVDATGNRKSGISKEVVYMHGETNVTGNASYYFIINHEEEDNHDVIESKKHTITLVNDGQHGTVTVAAKEMSGESVTITVTPDNGYMLDTIEVKDANGNEVSLKDMSFTMPDSNVTITVKWKYVGVKGDVNRDGNVDISDVVALVNIILNSSSDHQAEADLNNDGDIDISDVVALVNIILGQ